MLAFNCLQLTLLFDYIQCVLLPGLDKVSKMYVDILDLIDTWPFTLNNTIKHNVS